MEIKMQLDEKKFSWTKKDLFYVDIYSMINMNKYDFYEKIGEVITKEGRVMEEVVDKRFIDIVKYAYNSVPLYMRRENISTDDMEWENIPILKKEEILKNPGSFFSSHFLSPDKESEIVKDRTSGTTGTYMELYWNKDDVKKSLLTVWLYRKKYYGISPKDKMCYFYTTSNIGYQNGIEYSEEAVGNMKGFSKNDLNTERLLHIYNQIIEYQPVWMFLQPSMAILLCDAAEKSGRGITSLKYIEFTGEMLTIDVKNRVEKVFGCKTANHYGCNEVHTIAYECPFGNMHIAEKNVYVEVADEKMQPIKSGEEGRLIITSAVNRIMPFIRYDIGDRGVIHYDICCKCGCKSPVLELTKGRVHDYLELKNGIKVNAYIFVHAIEVINRDWGNCIRQFQIVQKDYEKILVKLAIDYEIYGFGITNEILAEKFLQNILQEDLDNISFEFQFYEELFPDNGKLLWFSKEI